MKGSPARGHGGLHCHERVEPSRGQVRAGIFADRRHDQKREVELGGSGHHTCEHHHKCEEGFRMGDHGFGLSVDLQKQEPDDKDRPEREGPKWGVLHPSGGLELLGWRSCMAAVLLGRVPPRHVVRERIHGRMRGFSFHGLSPG